MGSIVPPLQIMRATTNFARLLLARSDAQPDCIEYVADDIQCRVGNIHITSDTGTIAMNKAELIDAMANGGKVSQAAATATFDAFIANTYSTYSTQKGFRGALGVVGFGTMSATTLARCVPRCIACRNPRAWYSDTVNVCCVFLSAGVCVMVFDHTRSRTQLHSLNRSKHSTQHGLSL